MRVEVAKYPQLHALCWNRHDHVVMDGRDALALYERNWRFVDQEAFTFKEKRLLTTLVAEHGNGVLNV